MLHRWKRTCEGRRHGLLLKNKRSGLEILRETDFSDFADAVFLLPSKTIKTPPWGIGSF
jgi:hypothetical protein